VLQRRKYRLCFLLQADNGDVLQPPMQLTSLLIHLGRLRLRIKESMPIQESNSFLVGELNTGSSEAAFKPSRNNIYLAGPIRSRNSEKCNSVTL